MSVNELGEKRGKNGILDLQKLIERL